ncbi:MAG: hypothetical protein AB7T37_18690 [Dehalococcoidia bacterium]
MGLQLPSLLHFEDVARELPGRAVDAEAGNGTAPALGLIVALVQVAKASP